VPESRSVELRQLKPEANYRAEYFDPVTGERTPLDNLHAGSQGTCNCAPPKGQSHDWVLVLR